MNKFFTELKRRNIFRVAGVYAVVGWILMQVVAVMTPALHLPDWVDSFFAVMLIIGFPVAVLLAWAFEMTPEGVKRTENVADGDSISGQTGRKLDFAILFGLVLVAALVVGNRLLPQKTIVPDITVQAEPAQTNASNLPSIAVLPFADLSPAGDQEYFSDGIAEEILNVLVRVKGLSVTSRTSSFQFKGRDIGIPEIAKNLNVQHVLEGSVRKSGNTLRITAQLIDTSNDRHLWSDTFDRPLTAENIFEVQDEIAQAIVDALGESIEVLAKTEVVVAVATDNLTAYELFLQARPMYQARNDLDKADALLIRALEEDPQYAQAWEMRAALQGLMVDYGYASTPREEFEQKTVEYAKRALAINADSATALAAIARLQADAAFDVAVRGDFAAILAGYDRALAINPHDGSALNWRGLSLASLGYLDAALADFTRCVEYEPYYIPCVGNQLITLGSLGRDAEAVAVYKAGLRNGSVMIYFPPIGPFSRQGEEIALLSAFNTENMLFGWHRHGELYDALRQPETEQRELAADMINSQKNRGVNSQDMSLFLATLLGDHSRVLVHARLWDASFKKYRQSDNFKLGIEKSGILDYWREHGFPPQCRPLPNKDFECD